MVKLEADSVAGLDDLFSKKIKQIKDLNKTFYYYRVRNKKVYTQKNGFVGLDMTV